MLEGKKYIYFAFLNYFKYIRYRDMSNETKYDVLIMVHNIQPITINYMYMYNVTVLLTLMKVRSCHTKCRFANYLLKLTY